MKNIVKISSVLVLSSMLILPFAAYALDVNATVNANAQVGGTNTTVDAKLQTRIDTAKDRANKEIDRRIDALNTLTSRVGELKRLTADEKTNISAALSNQITLLTNLKTKIAADTDITTLKADIKSITQSYRIFLVVLPQGRIAAAADEINTTADLFATLSAKIQAKITDAQNAGKDVSSLNTLLTEATAKVADSKIQADASVAHTANLKPDNGDQAVMKANNDAFKMARSDLKIAHEDLVTARQDVQKIIVQLRQWNVGANATTTTTVH